MRVDRLIREIRIVVMGAYLSAMEGVSAWWEVKVSRARQRVDGERLRKLPPPMDIEEEFHRHDSSAVNHGDVRERETRYIELLCIRYGIPLPSRSDGDSYEEFYDLPEVVLTPRAKTMLLDEIEKAKKKRLDSFRSWSLAVSAVLGIVVALAAVT